MNSNLITAVRQRITSEVNNRHSFLEKYSEYIVLIVLILANSVFLLSWLKQDTRPMVTISDGGMYLGKMFSFVYRLENILKEGNFHESTSVGLSLGGRSPLYQLFTVPLMLLFGRSSDIAVFVNNASLGAILIISVFGIGKTVRHGRAGLLAAFVVACYPPIIHHSRIYSPVSAEPAFTALCLWLLLLLLKTRSEKIAWLFGAFFGLAVLVRLYLIVYLATPILIFGIYMLLFQTDPKRPNLFRNWPAWLLAKLREPFVIRGLFPAFLIASGLIATWNLPKLSNQLFYASLLTTERKFEIGNFLWYYAQTLPSAISNVLSFFFAIGLIAAIIKRRLLTNVMVVAFLNIFIFYSVIFIEAVWRQFASALPIVATFTVLWFFDIRHRLTRNLIIGICIVVSILNFSMVNWGIQSWNRPIMQTLGSPLASESCVENGETTMLLCPNSAEVQDWRINDILQIVTNDPLCNDHQCQLLVVPREIYFNYPIFFYYALQEFPEFDVFISQPGDSMSDTYHLSFLLESEYIVYVPEMRSSELNNQYSLASMNFLLAPPNSFANAHQEVISYVLPNGGKAILLKRITPLTVDEVDASLVALQLPAENKNPQWYIEIGHMYESLENPDRAIAVYLEGLQLSPDSIELHLALADAYLVKARSDPRFRQINLDLAETEYKLAQNLDASNSRAQTGLDTVHKERGE